MAAAADVGVSWVPVGLAETFERGEAFGFAAVAGGEDESPAGGLEVAHAVGRSDWGSDRMMPGEGWVGNLNVGGGGSVDGDAFGEIARFIDVAAEGEGGVVGEELEGDGVEDGLEEIEGGGDADDGVGEGIDFRVGIGGDGDDWAAACFDFVDGADVFGEEGVVGAETDGRRMGVDEGDDPVFEFGGGEACGVDVGDFLHFEGAFEGDGEEEPAAEEEHAMGGGEASGDGGDGVGLGEDGIDLCGELFEGVDEFEA